MSPRMNRRQALKALAALGATGLTAACAGSGADDSGGSGDDAPVRIGLLVPQTGGLKTIGDEILRGFQLFINRNGGQLGGHPVQLETANEGDTVEAGVAGLRRLLDRGVVAVSGVVSPKIMLGIRETIRQAKVPLVGSNASPRALQGEVYIWRTSFVNDDAAKALGPYVADTVTGKVVMVAPSFDNGQESIDGFRDGFGWLDPRLEKRPVFAGEDTDPPPGYFAPAIQAIKASNAAAVFCDLAGSAAVRFVREYRSAKIPAALYGSGFLTEGVALTALGDDAANITTAMNYSADLPFTANREFTAAYRQAHNATPTTYAMASYDAAQVLGKAISLAGRQPSAQQVNLMLGNVGQVDSPRGTWQFNQIRTPQQRWYLRQVRRDGAVLANVVVRQLSTLG